MDNKAVVLGSNYYIGLSIIRCLGIEGVHTVAVDYSRKDAYGSKSRYLSEHLIAPHYRTDPKGLLYYLVEYAKKQKEKPVLFPGADPYVEFMDNNLEKLKEYYLIPMTEQGLWTEIMDKKTLSDLALKHGVRVPETASPKDPDFYEQVERDIKFPCIIKPSDSAAFVAIFRKKIFQCENMEELKKGVELAAREGLDVIVQRIIPGFDDHMYTFDAYLDQNSKVTHWMTCQKYRQYPINFGASVFTGQKYVQELYDIGAPFMEAIGYKGFGEIEFKKDAKTGRFYLIEINVRTTNLNSLLYKAGINFPYAAYRDMVGYPLPPHAVKKDTGIVFHYLFEDLLAIRGYTKTKQLSYGQIAKSLMARKAPAIWSLSDPKPALGFTGMLAKKALRKVMRTKKKK